jgi:hypothetical protein
MAPQNQQQQAVAAATIRLPDFYAESLQAWFDCLDSMFAIANITQPITKFHWAFSKLPFSLTATVPPSVQRSHRRQRPVQKGLSTKQMTSMWLDYSMCSDTRPSVLWDNLTTL